MSSEPSEVAKADFIDDVLVKMVHEVDEDKVTLHRSRAWPSNALNELNHLYQQAIRRHLHPERQELERLRKALRFYAKRDNYDYTSPAGSEFQVNHDRGLRARQALKGTSDEPGGS